MSTQTCLPTAAPSHNPNNFLDRDIPMTLTEIERALSELRLSGIAATLNTRVMQAQSSQEPFLDTFASMLQDELDRRRSRLTERRFKQSGLDERLSLADFDWRLTPRFPGKPASNCTPSNSSPRAPMP